MKDTCNTGQLARPPTHTSLGLTTDLPHLPAPPATGKWSEEEERRLTEVVYEMAGVSPGSAVTAGVSWATVAERVGTRSEKQCRSKWLNYLNWKHSGGTEWTKEDDLNLIHRSGLAALASLVSVAVLPLTGRFPAGSPSWRRRRRTISGGRS